MDTPVKPDTRPLHQAIARLGEIIVGKQEAIQLAVTCLLARGHLLIEDQPGVGKTTLAHAVAAVMGLQYQRIQFTSDLLPADILGVSIFEQATSRFTFHPGPIFAQLILADEVNRATPKTQSALLEAMEERQVTMEGQTRPLPEPFFVIATQNPTYQIGTFSLPESQLDRFLIRLELGYPDADAERALLSGVDRRDMLEHLSPVLTPDDLLVYQQAVSRIHVSDGLLDYLQAIIALSRELPEIASGLSPRAGLALLRAARARALLADRDHVLPDDLQAVLPGVVTHRLRPATGESGHVVERLVQQLLDVPIP
ncbi:AAA family ATPase [Thiohalophilus thiocyanatoxydans]|uniref:MoxR-like ATPase n=1 Tax=Thiohalophilus thiocyanatoxydans TaxID=381308 RepID=A0A4R8ISD1_9GAMM|nr:AAA family ATPase [Thiohalophilus thiocyanatoxydans]TDY03876.1 MoxR-like ATPase [Thiohalophilus thiocyanatoxydans]